MEGRRGPNWEVDAGGDLLWFVSPSFVRESKNASDADAGELEALKEHLEYAFYPEMASDIEAVQRAITATVEGRPEELINFKSGWVEKAAMVCAALDLEPFVEARLDRDSRPHS